MLSSANVACNKSEQHEEPETKWDLPIHLLGNRIPSSVTMNDNSVASITFVGSSLTYKFDLNRIDANYFWGKLVVAQKTATAVRVYITVILKL